MRGCGDRRHWANLRITVARDTLAEVIKNREAYARRDERDRSKSLAELSVEESLAIGEALLTSELMDLAVFADDDHPLSLARSLGITPKQR